MTSWSIASSKRLLVGVTVGFARRQIGKHMQEARLQNPYMHAHKEAGSRGRRRDKRQRKCTDKNTESPACTSHHWSMLKVSDICLLVLLLFFSSLMLKLLNGWKQEELPKAQRLNMCIFYFPNHPSWQAWTLLFFPRLPFSFSKNTFSPLLHVNCCPPFCIQQVKCTCKR